ncbi:MAG TPA: hypothetical protein VFS86_10240 [Rhodanobacteraceae bacterium]|nr:hypothetical protein [Rhodanobacteraceae bacterium]
MALIASPLEAGAAVLLADGMAAVEGVAASLPLFIVFAAAAAEPAAAAAELAACAAVLAADETAAAAFCAWSAAD